MVSIYWNSLLFILFEEIVAVSTNNIYEHFLVMFPLYKPYQNLSDHYWHFHLMDWINILFFNQQNNFSKMLQQLMTNLEKKHLFVEKKTMLSIFAFKTKKRKKSSWEYLLHNRELKFDRCGWGLCQREVFFFCHSYANLWIGICNILCICSAKMKILAGKFFGAAIHSFTWLPCNCSFNEYSERCFTK